MSAVSAIERIKSLDVSLFDHVVAQTTPDDRRSLLALQTALGERLERFVWLEIGSYLGGSLQPLVVDPRCVKVISIDPRLRVVPDDRPWLGEWDYGPENTTDVMLAGLSRISDADVTKVEPIEMTTSDIQIENLDRPNFCFVDGEHTRTAVSQDARFCHAAMGGKGVIAFHDFRAVDAGIGDFLRVLRDPYMAYLLPTSVFVVEIGKGPSLLGAPVVRDQLHRQELLWKIASRLRLTPSLFDARRFRNRVRSAVGTR